MDELLPDVPSSIEACEKRLDSWKEPAKAFVEAYLGLGENDQAFD